MGADCCGTPEVQPGSEHPHNMQNGASLLSNSHQNPQNKTKQAPVAVRPHKEYVQKREPYYKKRVDLFEQYYQREVDRVKEAKQANRVIKVTLPDGAVQDAVANVTTPMDIAKTLAKSIVKKAVVAKVKAESASEARTWDLLRPLEENCTLELCTFEDKTGKDVSSFLSSFSCVLATKAQACVRELQTFWHSSSHILGQALELEFGVDLTIGPAIEEGFYYDCYLEDGRTLTDSDKAAIEKRMQQVRAPIYTPHTSQTALVPSQTSSSQTAQVPAVLCPSHDTRESFAC